MEYWFIIFLALVAVVAIGLLLYFEVMGDDALVFKKKYKRGKFINDENAVICQTVKDTKDPEKAYTIFVEYIFSNQKQFLEYIKTTLSNISDSYNTGDLEALRQCIYDTKEMKVELKDQKISQDECVKTIDRYIYIEFAAWINIANNSRFSINDSLSGMAEVCFEYAQNYATPFPEIYVEQLNILINDICNICNSCLELIGTNNTQEMRELRKNMSVILDESYANAQRLFEVIHDGRSQLDIDKHIALKYALNAFQELHGIIHTLRRFVLANICITLSIQ